MGVRIANREDPDQTASSEILNTFLYLFSNNLLVLGITISHYIGIANREDPEAV